MKLNTVLFGLIVVAMLGVSAVGCMKVPESAKTTTSDSLSSDSTRTVIGASDTTFSLTDTL